MSALLSIETVAQAASLIPLEMLSVRSHRRII
jgi:hypothetical protein